MSMKSWDENWDNYGFGAFGIWVSTEGAGITGIDKGTGITEVDGTEVTGTGGTGVGLFIWFAEVGFRGVEGGSGLLDGEGITFNDWTGLDEGFEASGFRFTVFVWGREYKVNCDSYHCFATLLISAI